MAISVSQLQKLLEINQRALDYHVEATTVLVHQLPAWVKTPIPRTPSDTSHLHRKTGLIDKYRPKFPDLLHPNETATVFQTIYDFILPDIISIRSQVQQWMSSDYPDLLSVIITYLYPPSFLEALNYLATVPQWVFENNNRDEILCMDQVSYDVPTAAFVKNQLQCVLDEAMKLFPNWQHNQAKIFTLSVQRDLLDQSMSSSDNESTYENTMLQAILSLSDRDSPPTYVGHEALMYEVMEVLTFYLDVVPTIANNVEHYYSSLSVKLAYARNVGMDSPVVTDRFDLRKFSDETVANEITAIVAKGSQGLVQTDTYNLVSNRLIELDDLLSQFNPVILGMDDDLNYICRDELYFGQAFKEYASKFHKLADMLRAVEDPTELVSSLRSSFEVTDYDLKDLTFDVLHFNHRFYYGQPVLAEMMSQLTT